MSVTAVTLGYGALKMFHPMLGKLQQSCLLQYGEGSVSKARWMVNYMKNLPYPCKRPHVSHPLPVLPGCWLSLRALVKVVIYLMKGIFVDEKSQTAIFYSCFAET